MTFVILNLPHFGKKVKTAVCFYYSGMGIFALGHELGHYIRSNFKENFAALTALIKEEINRQASEETGKKTFESLTAEKYGKYKQYREQGKEGYQKGDTELYALAEEDVVCDALSSLMADRDTFSALADKIKQEDRTLWQKIKDFIERFLTRLDETLQSFAGVRAENEAGRAIQNAMKETRDEIRALYVDAFVRERAETQEEESRYSEREDNTITAEDVQTLRKITNDHNGDRVSVNDFTSEDIKKAEPWARNYWKEFKESGINPCISPFFRAWFGDWRAEQKEAIKIAAIPEYVDSNEERKKSRGTERNEDTAWDIRISREGETNTISHSGNERLSEYGLSGIRELVQNAVLLDTEVHEHHKNNAYNDYIAFDHKMYALGKDSGGNVALYKITVEEAYQDIKHTNEKKFHNLKYIEKIASVGGRTAGIEYLHDVSTNDDNAIFYSVSDLYSLVKTYDKDFHAGKEINPLLLNEDGTPKVFYHGTRAENGDFTVFDYSKAIKKGGFGLQTLGKGNYFSSKKFTGTERFAQRIIPAYLRLENPLVLNSGTDYENAVSKALGTDIENYSSDEVQKMLKDKGIDGVIAGKIVNVFDSNNIKSATDNIGTFDRGNKDIRFSEREETAEEAKKQTSVKEDNIKRESGYSDSNRGNGYDGYSMSNNARAAYQNGEKPKSKWSKTDIIDAVKEIDVEKAKLLEKVNLSTLKNKLLRKSSWHHTSDWYNATDFYSVDENIVGNLTIDEIKRFSFFRCSR